MEWDAFNRIEIFLASLLGSFKELIEFAFEIGASSKQSLLIKFHSEASLDTDSAANSAKAHLKMCFLHKRTARRN